MEQRVIYFSQQQTSHKIKNKSNIKNINKTRIIVMGKAYTINKKTLRIYKTIGNIVGTVMMLGLFYIMYCVMWILG